MWNIFKIYKYSKSVFEHDGQELIADQNGEERLEEVQALIRELMFPSNLLVWKHLTKNKERRNIIWGTGWNDAERVDQEVLPVLKDKEYLQSLPPNTVGAHLGHLYNRFDLTELYEKRFLEEEARDGSTYDGATDQMRTNIARHMFLTHDIWHCLFRYDTAPFGEGLIQNVTWQQSKNWATWYVGFVVTCRVAWRAKSWKPFAIYREAGKIGKEAAKLDLIANTPTAFLEMDIEEVRKKFNIQEPKLYLEWIKEHPDTFRGDTFHPNCPYSKGWIDDGDWDTTVRTL